MNLYMDDVRAVPVGWTVARSVKSAKAALETGDVDYASLDHDMGACDDCTRTGDHVGDMLSPETTYMNWCRHAEDGTSLVRWMIETGHWPKHKPIVHSANPVGRERMQALIEAHFPGVRP